MRGKDGYRNWARELFGKWLKPILNTAGSYTNEMAACTARHELPPLPSPPSHEVFIFLACGVGMMHAQMEIVLEDFSWQNGCQGCQIFSKM